MAVLDLAHLTWEEVRDLDRTKTVAIVAVGAVEAHGPHLPLATDVIIAEAMARAAAGRLAARGPVAVLLPAIANTHLAPGHLRAIEAAVTQIRRADGARIVFPDVTKNPWAVRLTDEFRS